MSPVSQPLYKGRKHLINNTTLSLSKPQKVPSNFKDKLILSTLSEKRQKEIQRGKVFSCNSQCVIRSSLSGEKHVSFQI